MFYNTFPTDRNYVEQKFRGDVCPADSGLANEQLQARAVALFTELEGQPHAVVKARAFELLAEHVRIDVNEHDFFPSFGCRNRYDRPLRPLLEQFSKSVWREIDCDARWTAGHREKLSVRWRELNEAGVTNLWLDFDHSVPEWERLMQLGFPGILQEIRTRRAARTTLTPAEDAYFTGLELTYSAILKNLRRLIDCARANGSARTAFVAEALCRLREGAPRNCYQALLAIYLYFVYSEHFDHMQVRSLGNLDRLLWPYFERDLQEGTFTEEEIRMFLDYFLMQWASIDNYWGHPFYLGGTGADGTSLVNRLSFLILEEFDKLRIPTPKIQLKIARNTSDQWLDAALNVIRNGNSSLVFVGEEGIARAMTSLGMTLEDARTCDISGCYEFLASGIHHENTTVCGHLNLLKPFEWILHRNATPQGGFERELPVIEGARLNTFRDFFASYCQLVRKMIDWQIELGNITEQYLDRVNPANVFSGVVAHSLLAAKDGFAQGCCHNNTALLCSGFGTAVDALSAVKEFVYERKAVSLAEFGRILENNWHGAEKLRQRILHSADKYGNGVDEVDRCAASLAHFLGRSINGRPNGRGGIWKASGHNARQFIELGAKTGATPDGRLAGEEMSKNLSPAMGMDRGGVTALLNTVRQLDVADFPGDFPLDLMLHPSSVRGEEGLAAWRTLVRIYLANGGHAVHFNIFDAEELKAAQRMPEKYQGLQVRVCGWNVHFIELDKTEQEQYIRRAENISC